MGNTFIVGAAHVGALIDTAGKITAIGYQKRPVGSEQPEFEPGGLPKAGYFCLVDKPQGQQPHQLFSLDMHSNPVYFPTPGSENNVLTSANGIPFDYLYVQSCPRGAIFSLTTVAVDKSERELPSVPYSVGAQSSAEQLAHAREQQEIQSQYPGRQRSYPTEEG